MSAPKELYRITISQLNSEAKANPPAAFRDEDFTAIEIIEVERDWRQMDAFREAIALVLDSQLEGADYNALIQAASLRLAGAR